MSIEFIISSLSVVAVAIAVFFWLKKKYPDNTIAIAVGIAVTAAMLIKVLVSIFFKSDANPGNVIVQNDNEPASKPAAEAIGKIVDDLEEAQAKEVAKPIDANMCKEIDGV